MTTNARKIMLNKREVQYLEADNDDVLIHAKEQDGYRVQLPGSHSNAKEVRKLFAAG